MIIYIYLFYIKKNRKKLLAKRAEYNQKANKQYSINNRFDKQSWQLQLEHERARP